MNSRKSQAFQSSSKCPLQAKDHCRLTIRADERVRHLSQLINGRPCMEKPSTKRPRIDNSEQRAPTHSWLIDEWTSSRKRCAPTNTYTPEPRRDNTMSKSEQAHRDKLAMPPPKVVAKASSSVEGSSSKDEKPKPRVRSATWWKSIQSLGRSLREALAQATEEDDFKEEDFALTFSSKIMWKHSKQPNTKPSLGSKVQTLSPSTAEKHDKIKFVYSPKRKRSSQTSREAQGAAKMPKPL